MILIDAHEDLAYNILTFGRDYTQSALVTRQLEAGTETPLRNGDSPFASSGQALLGWPEYQKGKVAVVFGTLFVSPGHRQSEPWETQVYRDVAEANRLYRDQVDAYYRLSGENPDKFRLVLRRRDLEEVLEAWENTADFETQTTSEPEDAENEAAPKPGKPVGVVILMEGAEGVRHPDELEEWWNLGVRIIGPAWAGTRFCGGTRQPGPLTQEGYALLEGMAGLGFGLDISHMDEAAVMQALDFYPGTILASHANAWALLRNDSNRHLPDRVIRGLVERDGVVGIVPFNVFLKNGWRSGDPRSEVGLSQVVAQIDHVCQLAGSARHAALGTDFEGGFGLESVPAEIDTIADLRKLIPLLAEKGYSDDDIRGILSGNWLRMLQRILL
jgi:membrane dipeptidase